MDVTPLTPAKVHAVGSLLKIGKYRSSKNFLSAIKTVHSEGVHPWGPALELAGRRFLASTQRGMGPPRQSERIKYEESLNIDFPIELVVKGGPLNSKAVHVTNTMFLTREIESSLALRRHVTLHHDDLKVSWRLPVSRADP